MVIQIILWITVFIFLLILMKKNSGTAASRRYKLISTLLTVFMVVGMGVQVSKLLPGKDVSFYVAFPIILSGCGVLLKVFIERKFFRIS